MTGIEFEQPRNVYGEITEENSELDSYEVPFRFTLPRIKREVKKKIIKRTSKAPKPLIQGQARHA